MFTYGRVARNSGWVVLRLVDDVDLVNSLQRRQIGSAEPEICGKTCVLKRKRRPYPQEKLLGRRASLSYDVPGVGLAGCRCGNGEGGNREREEGGGWLTARHRTANGKKAEG